MLNIIYGPEMASFSNIWSCFFAVDITSDTTGNPIRSLLQRLIMESEMEYLPKLILHPIQSRIFYANIPIDWQHKILNRLMTVKHYNNQLHTVYIFIFTDNLCRTGEVFTYIRMLLQTYNCYGFLLRLT